MLSQPLGAVSVTGNVPGLVKSLPAHETDWPWHSSTDSVVVTVGIRCTMHLIVLSQPMKDFRMTGKVPGALKTLPAQVTVFP